MFRALIPLWFFVAPCWSQWQAIGPFGGAVNTVQVDAGHPGAVVAGTSNALLFRSADNGEHWEPLAFAPALRSVLHALLIDSKGTYLAGIASDAPELNGLYRSTNEGKTWEHVPGLRGQEIWSLAVWQSDSNTIAAGARDGVHLSRDGGATWKRISPLENHELQPVVSLAFHPKDSKILYAGTPHLPWKTIDGGASWHSAHAGMLDDSDVFSIQVDWNRPEHVFATACSGIYASANSAGLWAKMAGAKGASYRTYVVAQDPKNPSIVFAGTTGGLVRSNDSGVTWRKLSDDASRAIAFDPTTPGRIFVATDQRGILRSENRGDSLSEVNQGLCNRHFSALGSDGKNLFATSIYESESGGMFRLDSSAVSGWERVGTSAGLQGEQILKVAAVPDSPGHFIAAGYNAFLRSTDSGKTWTRSAAPAGSRRLTSLLPLAGKPDGILLGSEAGLFRSLDQGRTWKPVPFFSSATPIRSLVSLSKNAIAAITPNGIFISKDGSNSWESVTLLPGKPQVYALIQFENGRILAATATGLNESEDMGQSWEPAYGGLEKITVSAMARVPGQPDRVLAAYYGTIFESNDQGRTWKQISGSQSAIHSIVELNVLPDEPSRVYALTKHQGIFALPLDKIASGPASRGTE
ncbi:MAG: YCF48-related protein [Acidobacteriota bacterium]|nr:YCF48-related protein [Acidobacteriota bacterium]